MSAYAKEFDITIAVMGCRVNGPGETDDADLGLWCAPNFVNLKKGEEELGAFPYDVVLDRLKVELDAIIAEKQLAAGAARYPQARPQPDMMRLSSSRRWTSVCNTSVRTRQYTDSRRAFPASRTVRDHCASVSRSRTWSSIVVRSSKYSTRRSNGKSSSRSTFPQSRSGWISGSSGSFKSKAR